MRWQIMRERLDVWCWTFLTEQLLRRGYAEIWMRHTIATLDAKVRRHARQVGEQ